MKKVSIVTVAFNSAATIAATLQSVRRQTHEPLEHVVIDGASTDGTLELVRREGRPDVRLTSEPDDGIYDAMNRGWRQATGDIVGFLNSDDEFASSDVVSAIARAFEDESVDAVYGDLDIVDGQQVIQRRWRSGHFARWKYQLGWMTPHPCTYVRRSAFERWGGFRTELNIAADYELMLRFFVKHQCSVQYLPKTLVRMRAGGASTASIPAIIDANLQVYNSWKLNGLRTTPHVALLKPMSKLLQLRGVGFLGQ